MTKEEWRDIPGWIGEYQVSNQGRVRSLDRWVTQRNQHAEYEKFVEGQIIKQMTRFGYRTVCLRERGAAKRRPFGVHRLVCLAWYGEPPGPDYHAAHKDGTRDNNVPENLYWATPSENRYDAVRHGTHNEARKTACVKGHDFTPENTYMWRGRRKCMECKRQNSKAWYWRTEKNRQGRIEYCRQWRRQQAPK